MNVMNRMLFPYGKEQGRKDDFHHCCVTFLKSFSNYNKFKRNKMLRWKKKLSHFTRHYLYKKSKYIIKKLDVFTVSQYLSNQTFSNCDHFKMFFQSYVIFFSIGGTASLQSNSVWISSSINCT